LTVRSSALDGLGERLTAFRGGPVFGLDALEYLPPQNRGVGRKGKPKLNGFPPDIDDSHLDIIVDDDRFTYLSRQIKHSGSFLCRSPSGALSGRQFIPNKTAFEMN
jgi:hypothetical protein